MIYQLKFPKCPYRVKGSKHCSHKLIKGDCICSNPQKPERCDKYNELIKNNKIDSKEVSDDLKAIGVLT